MPEIAEVALVADQLRTHLPAHIDTVTLGPHGEPTLTRLPGTTITSVTRHGKRLWLTGHAADTTPVAVAAHLGMTGQLLLDTTSRSDHVHATLELTDTHGSHTLAFRDPRRFGHMRLEPNGTIPTGTWGPDLFDTTLTVEALHTTLARSRRPIKTLLLDQSVIAGAGNYLTDEALHLAGIHPHTPGRDIAPRDTAALLAALRLVAGRSYAAGGVTLRDYRHLDGSTGTFAAHLAAYGRAGQPCTWCGATLEASRVDGRTSTWCPTCQAAPHPN